MIIRMWRLYDRRRHIITSNPSKETDRLESQGKGILSCEWFIESSGTDSTIILKEIMNPLNPQPRYSLPRVVKVCTYIQSKEILLTSTVMCLVLLNYRNNIYF